MWRARKSPALACRYTPHAAAWMPLAPRAHRPAITPESVSPEPERPEPHVSREVVKSGSVRSDYEGLRALQRNYDAELRCGRPRHFERISHNVRPRTVPELCHLTGMWRRNDFRGWAATERPSLRQDAQRCSIHHHGRPNAHPNTVTQQIDGGLLIAHPGSDQNCVGRVYFFRQTALTTSSKLSSA